MIFQKRLMWLYFITLMALAICFNVSLANQVAANSGTDAQSEQSKLSATKGKTNKAEDGVVLFNGVGVAKTQSKMSSIPSQNIDLDTYNTLFVDNKAVHQVKNHTENAIIPAKNKQAQDFVRQTSSSLQQEKAKPRTVIENDFKVFESIKPTQYYRTSHSFSIFQSPIDLQTTKSATKISTQSGIDVKQTQLKPFSENIPAHLLTQESIINSSGVNQPSAFLKNIEIEDKRTMGHLKTTKPVVHEFSSTEGISILSPDGLELQTLNQDFIVDADEQGHVDIKQVQHRNNFAASYKRRLMSRAEYITYFDWVNDHEIEQLHDKILKEYQTNPKSHTELQRVQVAWSNLAMSNMRSNFEQGHDDYLSISKDPNQERNLSMILGVTTSHSATVSSMDLPLTQDNAPEAELPNTALTKQPFIFDQTINTQDSNLAFNPIKSEESISNNLQFTSVVKTSTDTGELSLQALTNTTENPFVESNNLENSIMAQQSDFNPNVYLDQLLPSENIEAVSQDTPPARTFKDTVPKVIEDTSSTNQQLPFKIYSHFDGNRVIFDIDIKGKSYLYRDSLKLESKNNIGFELPELPNGVMHQDIQGEVAVYFEHLTLAVPIINCQLGDELTFSYQGCDEQGICYPVQSYTITMPNAILIQDESTGIINMLTDSIEFLQNGEGNSIAEILQDNLLLGLLVCFILGIGLDLTPCVLPMLPIFSTMLVGSCKNKVDLKDDFEIEADKASAHLEDNASQQDNTQEQDKTEAKTEEKSKVKSQTTSDPAQTRKGLFSRFDGEFKTILIQNFGYTMGLSLTYMVLGLLFSSLGASLHSVLQSSVVLIGIAILLCICALSCAGIIEIKVPNVIALKLQDKISNLNTGKFSGAIMFGMLSALIASPCTSAPLAGALLYVFATGNQMLGALYFLVIGFGMAFPLFLIGVFGSKFLSRSRVVGTLVKRILVIVLLVTAYLLIRHLLGSFDLVIRIMLLYIMCIYLLSSILALIVKHNLQMSRVLLIAVFSLIPCYIAYTHFEDKGALNKYELFTNVESLYDLKLNLKNNYSFVVFTANWCTNCEQMEQDVYSNDRFALAANDLNKFLVNITDTQNEQVKEFIKEYNLIGVPCYILLDPEGKVVEKRLGVQSRTSVINSIHQLKYQSKYSLET